jgi:hypothetical protein
MQEGIISFSPIVVKHWLPLVLEENYVFYLFKLEAIKVLHKESGTNTGSEN